MRESFMKPLKVAGFCRIAFESFDERRLHRALG